MTEEEWLRSYTDFKGGDMMKTFLLKEGRALFGEKKVNSLLRKKK